MNFEITSYTHRGRRSNNEDSCFVKEIKGNTSLKAVLAVADGMGGMAAGEVASRMAIEILVKSLETDNIHELHRSAIHGYLSALYTRINKEVYNLGIANASYHGMGTTLTVVLIFDNRFVMANLGDSRVYFLNGTEAIQISEDHNALAEALKNGTVSPERASTYMYGHALTRYIGDQESPKVYISELGRPFNGDAILLCTDGFYKYIEPELMIEELNSTSNIKITASNLASIAYQNGSDDNITIAIIRFGEISSAKQKNIVYDSIDQLSQKSYTSKDQSFSEKSGFPIRRIMLFFIFIILISLSYSIYNELSSEKKPITRLSFRDDKTSAVQSIPSEKQQIVQIAESIINRIEISKTSSTMKVYSNDSLIKVYNVAFAKDYLTKKTKVNDNSTPEGNYLIVEKNTGQVIENGRKVTGRLFLNYPNIVDAENAYQNKMISKREYQELFQQNIDVNLPNEKTKLGGLIAIHDGGTNENWTRGGIAMEKQDFDELSKSVKLKETQVIIKK